MTRATALILLLAVVLASCGGSDKPNVTDPRDVARAYVEAKFDCGDEGAGLRYDLSTSPNREWSRERYITIERRNGCRREPTPQLRVALVQPPNGDVAVVQVVGNEEARAYELMLVRVDGAWKVDTSRSRSGYPS